MVKAIAVRSRCNFWAVSSDVLGNSDDLFASQQLSNIALLFKSSLKGSRREKGMTLVFVFDPRLPHQSEQPCVSTLPVILRLGIPELQTRTSR